MAAPVGTNLAAVQDLVFLVLQFLEEEQLKDAAHSLERLTGLYFDLAHVESLILAGELDKCEEYIAGFTTIQDNAHSLKLFFELRKTKYLEALDARDFGRAVDILRRELQVFAEYSQEIFSEITSLISLNNFRENEKLKDYGDKAATRKLLLMEVNKLVAQNPILGPRCQLPPMPRGMLKTLVTQAIAMASGGGQPVLPTPRHHPPHHPSYAGVAATGKGAPRAMQNAGRLLPPTSAAAMETPAPQQLPVRPALPQLSASRGGVSFNTVGTSRSPPKLAIPGDSGLRYHASPPPQHLTDAKNRGSPLSSARVNGPSTPYTADSLPTLPACTLRMGAMATSFEFHPVTHTLLLAGTAEGNVSLLALAQQEPLFDIPCRTQNLARGTPVKRVTWSPDSCAFGAAFASCKGRGIIHLYNFKGPGQALQSRTEVLAHNGNVNDMAMTVIDGSVLAVTGGDDALVKVWSLEGAILHQFKEHTKPVYSVCTHTKASVNFIFSTGRDGRIKAWLYDDRGSRVDFATPGRWCTSITYSADGKRLFTCGVSIYNGETTLVEWNDAEGKIQRHYVGFHNSSEEKARIETAANRFILAGDDSHIKVWDMDEPGSALMVPLDADLPNMPLVRVNGLANLLAVNTKCNEVKILASPDGLLLLRAALQHKMLPCAMEAIEISSSGNGADGQCMSESSSLKTNPDSQQEGRANGKHHERSRARKQHNQSRPKAKLDASTGERNGSKDCAGRAVPTVGIDEARGLEVHYCPVAPSKGSVFAALGRSCDIVYSMLATEGPLPKLPVMCLLYTSTANFILALLDGGAHALWEAQTKPDCASPGPGAWQAVGASDMVNDLQSWGPKAGSASRSPACLALSRNDTYALSASGGRVELYNLLGRKPMANFQQPPPSATALAFHPKDNNLIALGLEDTSVVIFDVRYDTRIYVLQGHQDCITGLAFSASGALLVSSSADAKVCIWGQEDKEDDHYESKRVIRLEKNGTPLQPGQVFVRFHHNTSTFLTVHPTQVAIHSASTPGKTSSWNVPSSATSKALTDAAFSSDGSHVYVTSSDGAVGIFRAPDLQPVCAVTLPEGLHANTVAPNPIVSRPSEVSLGLGNGNVMVIQPFGGSASAWEQQDEEKSPPESGKGMVSSLSERPCKRQTRRPDADSGGSG